MTAIHFYHLTTTPLERALPKLLERCYGGGFRTIVLAEEARVERLNELLWTYDPNSFLPHGSEKDGDVELQPVLILGLDPRIQIELDSRIAHSGASENKTILFITNGFFVENPAPYDRVIDMFDGGDEVSLTGARSRWKQYKEAGYELHYYQQTSAGSWDKKAA